MIAKRFGQHLRKTQQRRLISPKWVQIVLCSAEKPGEIALYVVCDICVLYCDSAAGFYEEMRSIVIKITFKKSLVRINALVLCHYCLKSII